jgi:hypothetical protein
MSLLSWYEVLVAAKVAAGRANSDTATRIRTNDNDRTVDMIFLFLFYIFANQEKLSHHYSIFSDFFKGSFFLGVQKRGKILAEKFCSSLFL